MTPMHFTYFMAFIISMTGFMLHRISLISTLLCLESMYYHYSSPYHYTPYNSKSHHLMLNPMLVLSFSACEASLGVSLLVASSRTHNPNNLKNLNLLQC
uniref:NADH-ubiquinone oxidoreductase chain 4L n=1 Tax=Apalone ferox TaxID=100213 RepID=D5G1S5_APAFE|nr:NADH dehydrogenase subunit 4L [Apalone ferox]ACO83396.1 NADH dehydrogenase subunit 4L [Apalone ferox]